MGEGEEDIKCKGENKRTSGVKANSQGDMYELKNRLNAIRREQEERKRRRKREREREDRSTRHTAVTLS